MITEDEFYITLQAMEIRLGRSDMVTLHCHIFPKNQGWANLNVKTSLDPGFPKPVDVIWDGQKITSVGQLADLIAASKSEVRVKTQAVPDTYGIMHVTLSTQTPSENESCS